APPLSREGGGGPAWDPRRRDSGGPPGRGVLHRHGLQAGPTDPGSCPDILGRLGTAALIRQRGRCLKLREPLGGEASDLGAGRRPTPLATRRVVGLALAAKEGGRPGVIQTASPAGQRDDEEFLAGYGGTRRGHHSGLYSSGGNGLAYDLPRAVAV